MSSNILLAWMLAAMTMVVHAVGMALLLKALGSRARISPRHLWTISARLVWVTCYLILLHMIEISIWGAFYLWKKCMPDVETALYFSGVTYATIGYGDVVLEKPWRLFGPIEGLTGILMCGLSTGFFFAMVFHIYQVIHSNVETDQQS